MGQLRALLFLVLLALTSCSDTARTGVLVVVRVSGRGYVAADSPTRVTDMTIEVYSRSGGGQEWEQTGLVTQGVSAGAPIAYGLFPREGDTSRYYMTVVTLLHAGEPIDRRIAIGSFVKGRVGVLEMVFVADGLCFRELCVNANGEFLRTDPCEDERTACIQTCDPEDGQCVDVTFTPGGSLPGYDPAMPPDGVGDGGRDAHMDAEETDAGEDGEADAAAPTCGAGLPSCDDGIECTSDVCDFGTGRCTFTALCDDGDPCTIDRCDTALGACVTDPRCRDDDPGDCADAVCVRTGSTASCQAQAVEDGSPCDGGASECCSGACVDTSSNAAHCGECSRSCGASASCGGGECGCLVGRLDCTDDLGCETDPLRDEQHCGAAGPSCAGGAVCADGTSCIDGECRACTDAGDCDDGLTCTNDTCDGGECRSTPSTSFCLIDGVCYADESPSPFEPCAKCNADGDNTDWSPALGAACSDGLYCTTEVCDGSTTGAGACAAIPRDCTDTLACTTDSCSEVDRRCVHAVASNRCVVGGQCYADGEASGASGQPFCRVCDAARSQSAFSNGHEGMICGSMMTCAGGSCGPRQCTPTQATYITEHNAEVGQDTYDCAVSCSSMGDPHACFLSCFLAMYPGTPLDDASCVDCLADRADCARVNCGATCLSGGMLPACVSCQCGNGCQVQFDACAGTTVTNECT